MKKECQFALLNAWDRVWDNIMGIRTDFVLVLVVFVEEVVVFVEEVVFFVVEVVVFVVLYKF